MNFKVKNIGIIVLAASALICLPLSANAEVTDLGLCKGAVAVAMMKDPEIIKGRMVNGTPHVSYVRSVDGSRWDFKCKFPESGLVIWAGKDKSSGEWGRWRDMRMDSRIFYSETSDGVEFKEVMRGSTVVTKVFEYSVLD